MRAMKIKFLFIGRTKEGYLYEGIKDFLKRINGYLPASATALKGVKARDDAADQVRAADTARLLGALKPDDYFVCLDPGGKEMTSPELAAWLGRLMNQGTKRLCFGLGGPLGLDDQASGRANLTLSLSRLTLTHEMSRLVLVEQVYRALRLNAGHPYHK